MFHWVFNTGLIIYLVSIKESVYHCIAVFVRSDFATRHWNLQITVDKEIRYRSRRVSGHLCYNYWIKMDALTWKICIIAIEGDLILTYRTFLTKKTSWSNPRYATACGQVQHGPPRTPVRQTYNHKRARQDTLGTATFLPWSHYYDGRPLKHKSRFSTPETMIGVRYWFSNWDWVVSLGPSQLILRK